MDLPDNIILYTCEYDMLLAEARRLHDRLEELGKNVVYHMVPGVPHAWDKAPNPWKPTPGVREHYLEACKELRRIFGLEPEIPKRTRFSLAISRNDAKKADIEL